MSDSLSKAFVFGSNNAPFLDPASLEHDFFVGGPNRDRKRLELAQKEYAALQAIPRSIAAGSACLANEVQRFSDKMADALEAVNMQHSRDAIAVRDAIESLEDSLLSELSESRWLLAQAEERLSDVVGILKRPRGVEAAELMQQALANLLNGYHREAKDRLMKALEFDNTDYQIHRDLGFVFVHEDNGSRAAEHFDKASAFAPAPKLRVDALCDLARTHYASADYARAAVTLEQAMSLIAGDTTMTTPAEHARILYHHAVYCSLAGRSDQWLRSLDRAIELYPDWFAKALADADFGPVRQTLESFLTKKASDLAKQAERVAGDLDTKLGLLHENGLDAESNISAHCRQCAVLARNVSCQPE